MTWRSRVMLGVLVVAGGLASRAWGQICGDVPAGFRPHVQVALDADLIPSTSVIEGAVWLVPVFCDYSRRPSPALHDRDVRLVVAEGPEGIDGAVLRGRVVGRRLRIRVERPGDYVVRVHSPRHPSLEPATLRFRAFDATGAIRATIRLVRSPLDPGVRSSRFRLRSIARAARDRSGLVTAWQRGSLLVEPGEYRVEAFGRTSLPIAIREPGSYEVAFPGSRVSVEADWLPADGREYEVVLDPEDGTRVRARLSRDGAPLGADVPPGRAVLRVRATPRIDPWDAGDPRHTWTELRRIETHIPPSSDHVIRWSSPRLLAGVDPRPGPWLELPGLGAAPVPSAAPHEEVRLAFAVRGGAAVVVGDAVHELDPERRWRRFAVPSGLARETGPRRIAMLRLDAWAWIEGGSDVSFRTPLGLSQEHVETWAQGRAYPCWLTGIAVDDAGRIVSVGRCRPHAPEWDAHAPHEGFIAERDREKWVVRRGEWSPLRAVAWDGARFVAVGDGGQVVAGTPGQWRATRVGTDDMHDVAASRGRVVARTSEGRLLEIRDGAEPVRLTDVVDDGLHHAVTEHCLAGSNVIALHAARRWPSEGGRSSLPERLVVYRGAAPSTIEEHPTTRTIGLACDGDRAWVLERSTGGGLGIRRLPVGR